MKKNIVILCRHHTSNAITSNSAARSSLRHRQHRQPIVAVSSSTTTHLKFYNTSNTTNHCCWLSTVPSSSSSSSSSSSAATGQSQQQQHQKQQQSQSQSQQQPSSSQPQPQQQQPIVSSSEWSMTYSPSGKRTAIDYRNEMKRNDVTKQYILKYPPKQHLFNEKHYNRISHQVNELEQSTRHLLRNARNNNRQERNQNHQQQQERSRSQQYLRALQQHLVDWSNVLMKLPIQKLRTVMPLVDELAHNLINEFDTTNDTTSKEENDNDDDNDKQANRYHPTTTSLNHVVTHNKNYGEDSAIITSAIHGWAKLQSLQQYSSYNNNNNGHNNNNNNNNSHNNILQHRQPADMAEILLLRLQDTVLKTHNVRLQPKTASYEGVLDAFSKLSSSSSSLSLSSSLSQQQQRGGRLLPEERATLLLRHMLRISTPPLSSSSTSNEKEKENNSSYFYNPLAKPSNRGWNSVLNAWANKGNVDETMKLFKEMALHVDAYDKYTYSIVSKAFLRSCTPSTGADNGVNKNIRQQADAAHQLELILNTCIKNYFSNKRKYPMPTSIQYLTLIKCYSYQRQPQKAHRILNDMISMWENNFRDDEEKELQPTIRHFIPVMNCYAKSSITRNNNNNANPEIVQNLLLQMTQLYENHGIEACKPDIRSFVVVIDAYSKRRTIKDAIHAENILYRMEDQFLHNNNDNNNEQQSNNYKDEIRQMNAWGYNLVCDAYAHNAAVAHNAASSGDEEPIRVNAIEKIEEIIDRMSRLGKKYNNLDMMPNQITYTCLMRAIVKEGKPNFINRIESILQTMEDNAYNNKNRSENEIMMLMKPDTVTYATVLDAMAKSCNVNNNDSDDNNDNDSDNDEGVVDNDNDVDIRAEAILERMKTLYEKHHDKSVKPNQFIYNTMLNIYSKLGKAQKAEDLLLSMQKEYDMNCDSRTNKGKSNNRSNHHYVVKPTAVTYSTCIDAWSRSTLIHERFVRAKALFDMMIERYHKHNDDDYKPSASLFATLMTSLAKSNERNKVQVGLDIMKQLDSLNLPRNRVLYHTFLFACSCTRAKKTEQQQQQEEEEDNSVNNDDSSNNIINNDEDKVLKQEALKEAIMTFHRMKKNKHIIGVDSTTYNMMFMVVDNLMIYHDTNEINNAYVDLFYKCCDDGCLSNTVLDTMKRLMPASLLLEELLAPVVVDGIDDNKDKKENLASINITNLPQEWHRNATD